MRPRLHPAMGEIPICARVAVQLVYQEYRLRPGTTRPPSHITRFVLEQLPPAYPGMLRLALHSLSVYLDMGFTGIQWLTTVLEASHYGSSFRRCFFFDYKENRRPYPRVTNRGVQTSSLADQLPGEEESVNG